MRNTDSQEWILRTMRRIIRDSGPKTARRFLESRGGVAVHEAAARELARYEREHKEKSCSPLYQVHYCAGGSVEMSIFRKDANDRSSSDSLRKWAT